MKQVLAIAPLHNSDGKNDATGAFVPEAHAFCRALGVTPIVNLFDNRAPLHERADQVYGALERHPTVPLDVLAFFCHGWRDGIQAGFTLRTVPRLADAIAARKRAAGFAIVMYACDAARDGDADRADDVQPGPGGDGGFADQLRDELIKRGVSARVYAHSTPGHTTWNPYIRVFDTAPGDPFGGNWLVEPGSPEWAVWRRRLRHTDLRFTFWSMPKPELLQRLSV